MAQQYNSPIDGDQSTIGTQMNDFFYQKKALIELKKEQYFLPLASVVGMPKHMGKKIKKYYYIPLLDDANINDQGIDATGLALDPSLSAVGFASTSITFDVEQDAIDAAAAINVAEAGVAVKSGTDPWFVNVSKPVLSNLAPAVAATLVAAVVEAKAVSNGGNLYAGSKDIGAIPAKFPSLTENGGMVNRVGFKRRDIEGSIEKMGFYDEYTQESLDFDSDSELKMHTNREMLRGAQQMTEAALQIDLLNNAGLVKFPGTATKRSEVGTTIVTYRDLLKLSIDLDNNRSPKSTKMFTGTRMTDTKTIPGARIMYIGSELQPMFEEMVDLHGERAFIPVQKYAAGGNTLTGEIGMAGYFRLVVVPEMFHWAGEGAASVDDTFYISGGKLDVFPMLVVGDESFTTIGFQTSGDTVKFKIKHSEPGSPESYALDRFGEKGFMSIKWYYGFMGLRTERLALQLTAAKM